MGILCGTCGLTLGRDDMISMACWRDMIGLSNQALSLSAKILLVLLLEALPTIILLLVEESSSFLTKSPGLERGVSVMMTGIETCQPRYSGHCNCSRKRVSVTITQQGCAQLTKRLTFKRRHGEPYVLMSNVLSARNGCH